MTPLLIALAIVATGGAVVAIGAREPRLAVLGTLVALLGAAYVADPMPGSIALAARLAGAILGGFLMWVSLRGVSAHGTDAAIGLPGAAAIALAAFVAGWLGAITLGNALGAMSGEGPSIGATAPALTAGSDVSRAAMATAFAIAALATGSLFLARDVLRLGIGLLLMTAAAERLLAAAGGPSSDVAVLAFGLLLAAGGGAVAALVARSLRIQGDLVLRAPSSRGVALRSRGADEAHELGRNR